MELKEKVILISGASRGIGLASARALAAEGARVVLAARTHVEEPCGWSTTMDVTDDASVRAAIEAVLAREGRIDAVINMAGNGGLLAPWSCTDAETTRAMFDVHVLGAERVMRAVVPAMRRQGHGVIVNVASTVGWVPMPGAAAYSAAKAALVALSDVLRAELAADGVDVRVFAPPHTSTEAGVAWPLGLPKLFTPEEVARDLVRAMRRDRPRVVAGGNIMLLWIQRLSPRLAARIMERIGNRALAKLLPAPTA